MKAILPPLRAKDTRNKGATQRVSSSGNSGRWCSSDCSTCYKMTRSGVRYGNRCSHSARHKTKKKERVPTTKDDDSDSPEVRRKLVVIGASVVVVLLVVVGIALIFHLGKVSLKPQKSCPPEKNCEVRRWKRFYPAKETPQPAAKSSRDKIMPFLRLFKRGGKESVEPEPPSRLQKIISALRLTKAGKKNVSEERTLINISQGHALLSIGVFNIAITALVLLLVP